jgi:hypothetical protein
MASYERRSRATAVPSFCYNGRVAQLAERVCEKHETVVQIPRRHTFIYLHNGRNWRPPRKLLSYGIVLRGIKCTHLTNS